MSTTAQALLAFIALPGVVAFAIPITWLWAGSHAVLVHPSGLAPLLIGIVALLWCVRDFLVAGHGTLILVGWAFSFGVRGLFFYAAAVAVGFHLRVVFGEEPRLARTHAEEWQRYSNRVPRWL